MSFNRWTAMTWPGLAARFAMFLIAAAFVAAIAGASPALAAVTYTGNGAHGVRVTLATGVRLNSNYDTTSQPTVTAARAVDSSERSPGSNESVRPTVLGTNPVWHTASLAPVSVHPAAVKHERWEDER